MRLSPVPFYRCLELLFRSNPFWKRLFQFVNISLLVWQWGQTTNKYVSVSTSKPPGSTYSHLGAASRRLALRPVEEKPMTAEERQILEERGDVFRQLQPCALNVCSQHDADVLFLGYLQIPTTQTMMT